MYKNLVIKVLSYLKVCKNCDKYCSMVNNNICDFCKNYYCDQCNDKLRTFYGFNINKYCHNCNEFLLMDLNF